MKLVIIGLLIALVLLVVGCGGQSAAEQNAETEMAQQSGGISQILNNQPVPDLGGYSFTRQVIIDTQLAQNKGASTWTYTMTYDGRIIEICASRGYPIPYSTQLTNPSQPYGGYQAYTTIGNPEPDSTYKPESAAATYIQCIADAQTGTVTPVYMEQDVFALPYQIKADLVMTRVNQNKPSVELKVGQ